MKFRSESGVALVELAICIPLLILLTFGTLQIVSGFEAFQTVIGTSYEAARLASVDIRLASGTWQDLSSNPSCDSSDSNPCTGHPKTQNRIRWILSLYNEGNSFSQITQPSITTSLKLQVNSSDVPQPAQGLVGNAHDVVSTKINAAFNSPLKIFRFNVIGLAWVGYMYERQSQQQQQNQETPKFYTFNLTDYNQVNEVGGSGGGSSLPGGSGASSGGKSGGSSSTPSYHPGAVDVDKDNDNKTPQA